MGWVTGVPWNRYKDAMDADGDLPEAVEPREPDRNQRDRIVLVETKAKVPREFYMKKEDLDKHKITRGCPGCASMMYRGTARQPHNEKCRERFRDILKDDARVKNTKARKVEFTV